MSRFVEELRQCLRYFDSMTDGITPELERIILSSGPVESLRLCYPGPCPALARQARLYKWLVRPLLPAGLKLGRIGAPGDGGYVMPDPGANGIAYSLGISDNVSWDLEMAGRGFEVFQYDGSVDGPPQEHERFHFKKLFVGGGGNALPEGWAGLHELMQENGHIGRDDLVLQIDIEGSEWDVFSALGEDLLRSFSQIIVELHAPLHELHLLPLRNSVLRLLDSTHQAVHVHINNNATVLGLGGEVFWTALEVSYLRRDKDVFAASEFDYPLDMDRPCNPNRIEPNPGQWGLLSLIRS